MTVIGPFNVNPTENVFDPWINPQSNRMAVANARTYRGAGDTLALAVTRATTAANTLGLPLYLPAEYPGGPSLSLLTIGNTFIVPPPTGVAATDTVTIQSALNRAAAGSGGIVLLAPGTYNINNTLNVAANCELWGAGRGATTLFLVSGTNLPVVAVGIGVTNTAVRYLGVNGNAAGNAAPGPAGNQLIYLQGTYAAVSDCFLTNAFNNGVQILNGSFNVIRNCEITSCNLPIQIVASSNNNLIADNFCTNNLYGIYLYDNAAANGPARNIVRGNIVSGCTGTNAALGQAAGISITGAPQTVCTDNDCVSNTHIRGIECFDNTTLSSGCVIANNRCKSNGHNGIDTGPASFLQVISNHSEANGQNGIYLSGNQYARVIGNTCINNGQSVAQCAGIILNENTGGGPFPTECIVVFNTCIDTQGGGATQAYGIWENLGGASAYLRNLIFGNDVYLGNTAADLQLVSTTDIVAGNIRAPGAFDTSRTFMVEGSVQTSTLLQLTNSATLTEQNQFVKADASFVSPLTITLPTASGMGARRYFIRRTDGSGNTLTVTAHAGEHIEGVASINIPAGHGITIVADGSSNWWIMSWYGNVL